MRTAIYTPDQMRLRRRAQKKKWTADNWCWWRFDLSKRRQKRYETDEDYREKRKRISNSRNRMLRRVVALLFLSGSCLAQDLNPAHYPSPAIQNQSGPLVIAPVTTIAVAKTNINLSWIACPDAEVEGYNVYWGTAKGVYDFMMPVGNVTNATVFNLACGGGYHFAVTARSASITESEYGFNQITKLLGTSTNEVPVPTPLILEIFSNFGTKLESSANLQTWSRVQGVTFTNGVCRVMNPKPPVFYRSTP